MEEAKTRNLYEDLGLTNRQADQGEIHLAYQKLAHKLAPGNNPVPGSADAVELSKVDPVLLFADTLKPLFSFRARDPSYVTS